MEPKTTPRTQKPSADKSAYSLCGEGPVVFTDTPDFQAKPHKRRRRAKTLAKGGMYFGVKDRELMEWIAAFGWLNTPDLARLMATSQGAVRNRANRLQKHRLLTSVTGPDSRLLYLATARGLRVANLRGFRSDVGPKPSTLEHNKAMVGGLLMLRDLYPARPILTERELFAAINAGVLTSRVTRPYPWVSDYGRDFQRWQPVFMDSPSEARKRSDLLILWRDQSKNVQAPIPVEVELTVKQDQTTYRRWLVAYENAAAQGDLSPGLMFLTDDSSDVAKMLQRTLTRLDEENRDPISGKTPWSRLDIRIDSLGDYFESYRKAWGIFVSPHPEP